MTDGDNFAPALSWVSRIRRTSFVATFHLDERQFIERTHMIPEPFLDAAICVSNSQKLYVSRLVKQNNIKFIPHGIDTRFFVPDISPKSEKSVLCVGTHLRDFNTFARISRQVRIAFPKVVFRVIAPRIHLPRNVDFNGIEIICDISDVELRKYYQDATVVYLPLHDCTANNAVLEAQACGCPIVATRVGGIADYVSEEFTKLVEPGNDSEHVSSLTFFLLAPQETRNKFRTIAREYSLHFDWSKITSSVSEFVKTIK
jgi:glycosyltransferase involved in cell wall biosynthesis